MPKIILFIFRKKHNLIDHLLHVLLIEGANVLLQKDKARSEGKLMSEYRDLVKKGREQFRKELEGIMPEIQIKKRKGKSLKCLRCFLVVINHLTEETGDINIMVYILGFCSAGGRMTEEELNSLIAHAHRRIDQLQKQLAEQQVNISKMPNKTQKKE